MHDWYTDAEMTAVQVYTTTRISPRNIQFLCQKLAGDNIQYFKFKTFRTKQYIPQDLCKCGKTIVNQK